MPYSRPPSRGRSQNNNIPDHPQLPLATSRLLTQPDHQIPHDNPPADPNAPVQLGLSTPVELGVFPNTHWLEEFARVRTESRRSRSTSQALASSSSSHPRSELAQTSGSTRTPLPRVSSSAMSGEEEPSARDLESLRARMLAEIDVARRSLQTLGDLYSSGRPDPTTAPTNNSTSNSSQTPLNISSTDPQPISNPTTTTTPPTVNPTEPPNPDPNAPPNPSRAYRWMDILTLEEAPTRYAMEYQRAYESLLQGIRGRVARDSEEVGGDAGSSSNVTAAATGAGAGARAGAGAGAGAGGAANRGRFAWQDRPARFQNGNELVEDDDHDDDDDEDEDDDDDNDEDADEDDDDEEDDEDDQGQEGYDDSESDVSDVEGEYARLLERMRNPFTTSSTGVVPTIPTVRGQISSTNPSFSGSLSADLIAAEQEGRGMTVFQPTIVGDNPGMHRAHPLLIPSGAVAGEGEGEEEQEDGMEVDGNGSGGLRGGQGQGQGQGQEEGEVRDRVGRHHHHHVVVPHTHHHHHHHHHHLPPRAQASAGPSSAQPTANGSSRNLPSTSTHAPSCPLTRTKSVKRRKLDPSSKNPYTWIPSSMTHPIPKIPAALLPEYMRISRLPIRSIPTSLNRADCAARLLLTTDLSTRLDEHGPVHGLDQEPLLAVSFVGNGAGDDHDAAAVRADHPIPSTSGVYYYEMEIASKGRDGYISIGFCSRWTDLNRLVGWERESWGWHMDDGYIFESRGEGTNRGWPTSTTGDTIGCGIDFTTGKAFFTKNSVYIGEAFGGLQDKGRLYPAVGLRTPGEKLLVNFQGPFKYDIVSHVKRVQRWVQTSVKDAPVYMHIARPSEPVQTTATASTETADSTTITDPVNPSDKPSTNSDKDTGLADKIHTCSSCSDPPAEPTYRKKLVTDIDSSLSSSILEYLRSGGYVNSARGMDSVLQRRGAGGVEMPEEGRTGESAMQVDEDHKVDTTLPTQQTEEEGRMILLKSCRDAYAAGDLDLALSLLYNHTSANEDDSTPPANLSSFLSSGTEDKDNIWAFRFRMRHFYRCFLNLPLPVHLEFTPELQTQIDEFYYGPDSPFSGLSPSSSTLQDPTHRTLCIGRHIQTKHGSSTNHEIIEGLKVFGVMAYEDVRSVPDRLKRGMTDISRKKEAGRLFIDLRVYMGYPAMNKIEQAYRQTNHTLLELGVLHTSAEAAFLEIPK